MGVQKAGFRSLKFQEHKSRHYSHESEKKSSRRYARGIYADNFLYRAARCSFVCKNLFYSNIGNICLSAQKARTDYLLFTFFFIYLLYWYLSTMDSRKDWFLTLFNFKEEILCERSPIHWFLHFYFKEETLWDFSIQTWQFTRFSWNWSCCNVSMKFL